MFGLVPFIILFPALGAVLNLTCGQWMRERGVGIVACVASVLSFAVAVALFAALLDQPDGLVIELGRWIQVAPVQIAWALRVDTLSVTMMLLVTGVGTIIHIYAAGYMRGDPRYTAFFVYLNLFLVAMLTLVAADNFVMLFAGWEGVGLCSFLLIGFWFDKPDGEGWRNSSAARKAFLVNRVGDAGFILALLMIGTLFGSFSFDTVFEQAPLRLSVGSPMVVLLTLLLTMGAAAKSAQIPLFVWLPEAMAGPTPVSALIHAATMVTAGIYLVARSQVLFALAPFTQDVIVMMGALTALLAAGAAVAQFDIKRVLAYSTISQLGFMMVAAGMGAYGAALFHLLTHAFFKALLFLGAGSVVHALGHGGDMRTMGGLRTRLPFTYATFVIGALSLAGLPPLAGFFSKDEILSHAWVFRPAVFLLLSSAAFLTAFYIGRQIMLVFFGTARSEPAAAAVESPRILVLPLIVLALLSTIGGAINLPGSESFGAWLHHTIAESETVAFQPAAAGLSLALSLCGLLLAYAVYGRHPLEVGSPDPLAVRLGGWFGLMGRGWGLNDFYQRVLVRGFDRIGGGLARADERVFRGLDVRIVAGVRRVGGWVAPIETHQFNWNVVAILGGLALVLIVTLWMGGR